MSVEYTIYCVYASRAFNNPNHLSLVLGCSAHAEEPQELTKFNFGPMLIQWVKTLYNNITSCIAYKGWCSQYFSLQRGVRQGCPLSALLLLLVIEILACKVRQCNQIQGIQLPSNHIVKISLYFAFRKYVKR